MYVSTVFVLSQEFVKTLTSAQEQVQSIIGKDFYLTFMVSSDTLAVSIVNGWLQKDPENLYNELTPSQIDVLVGYLGQDHH